MIFNRKNCFNLIQACPPCSLAAAGLGSTFDQDFVVFGVDAVSFVCVGVCVFVELFKLDVIHTVNLWVVIEP